MSTAKANLDAYFQLFVDYARRYQEEIGGTSPICDYPHPGGEPVICPQSIRESHRYFGAAHVIIDSPQYPKPAC